ncbi:MAG: branched-chain amino acid ABC transporter permease [Planctomycetota bacterium]|jgi:branched-chain amino acid transport system permease protein|nr:branched-chain amino acid ABC transporter permease [Planctomycetota bacterium]
MISRLARLAREERAALLALLGAALLAFPLGFRENNYLLRIAINIFLYAILATSLNLINGYSGQFNIGQAGFYCVGAYTAAILATRHGVGIWLALPLCGLAASAASLLLGIPTARLKGIFLAMSTLGFSEIIRLIVLNGGEFTRGPMGIPGIPPASLWGWELRTNFHMYYLALALAALTVLVSANVLDSRIGRAWIAIREDELAARAMGIPTVRYKIYNLAFSTFWAGVAGCYYAFLSNFISADSFHLDEGFVILGMVLVGGLGSLAGPLIGAAILVVIPEIFRFLAEYRLILYGVAILITMHLRPQGICGGGVMDIGDAGGVRDGEDPPDSGAEPAAGGEGA